MLFIIIDLNTDLHVVHVDPKIKDRISVSLKLR